jgi:PAS domain S-box-containing protein
MTDSSHAEHDATQQKIAELEQTIAALSNELAEARAEAFFYRNIFESLPLPLVIFRSDGFVTTTNRQNEIFVQTPRENLVGTFNMYDDQEAQEKGYVSHFQEALQGSVSRMPPTLYDTAHAGLTAPDENLLVWSETTYFPLVNQEGEIAHIGEVSLDVTERMQIETSLQASETRFRHLAENAQDLIFRYRLLPTPAYEYISPSVIKILGYTPEDYYADPHIALKVTHPDEHERLVKLAQHPEVYQESLVIRHFHKNGSEVYLEMRHWVTYDENQVPVAIEGISRDITQQKRMEASLRYARDELEKRVQERTVQLSRLNAMLQEREERYRIISELTSDYVYIGRRKDEGHFFTEWVGGAFERITGYTLSEIQDIGWNSIVHPKDQTMVLNISRSLLENHSCVVEYRITTRQGETRWLRDHIRPMLEPSTERVEGIIGAVRDVTSDHLSSEALRLALDTAEVANRAKAEFLATISHEIRTPLNAIIGMTNLLLRANLTSQEKEFVEIARTSADSLLIIINDMLDFARIETGRLELEPEAFRLNECLEDALALFHDAALQKNLGLTYAIDDTVPACLYGDVTHIRQILVNLLSNAIKFTEQGEVNVTVYSTHHQGGNDTLLDRENTSPIHRLIAESPHESVPFTLHLHVTDTGIGIPSERLPHLFRSFGQLDASSTRRYSGTGLGLALSKRLAELMGGTIWVESDVGKGSTFYVTVTVGTVSDAMEYGESNPAKQNQAVDIRTIFKRQADRKMPSPLRILLAEDNTVNQRVMLRLLEHLGYRADVSANGMEVLDALERQIYDVILMDVRMPEMDGLETTGRIRTLLPPDQQPRIIAMTAYTMDTSRETCLEAGADDYLGKPVRLEKLAAVLQHISLTALHPASSNCPVDMEVFEQFCAAISGGNTDRYQELLHLFLDEVAQKLTQMQQAIVKNDRHMLSWLAHELQASSAQVGAFNLSNLCKQIESAIAAETLEATMHLVANAEVEYARVRGMLMANVAV